MADGRGWISNTARWFFILEVRMFHQNYIYLGTISEGKLHYVLSDTGYPVQYCNDDTWNAPDWYKFDGGIFIKHSFARSPLDFPLVQGVDSHDHCCLVAFFFKQWGEWLPLDDVSNHPNGEKFVDGHWFRKVGKKAAGRSLDGVEWSEFPVVETERNR